MPDAKALFVGGTSSNAGKSWMVTAICASLKRRGIAVAPFKAQNMSNNSYPCSTGGEIGRAQVAQAEACGLEPEPAMNPILLKPTGNSQSQIVVNGRVWKTLSAREYYAASDELWPHVIRAYADLARRFDVVIIEGAGSVSELNLRKHDLVNLGLVTKLEVPWIVVADIERGGIFGSVIGTTHVLTRAERRLFRGFAINKFRGDRSLFNEGVKILEDETGAPCLGVFPFAPDVELDAEDSLALRTAPRSTAPLGAKIAIVRQPHISNATDFRLLTWADWIDAPPMGTYNFIVLPGTKNTLDDLLWLKRTGLAAWIASQHAAGTTVIGVCGGFQMLGQRVMDPDGIESAHGEVAGLALLPIETVMTSAKRTDVLRATTPGGTEFAAYAIHAGRTVEVGKHSLAPFASLADGSGDGLCAPRVMGTYLHGVFENSAVCQEVFGVNLSGDAKTNSYAQLADWFDEHARNLKVLDLPF